MIKILSEETINKIAAGEVVERPASIVKELIENSIDACSSSISVEVKSGGRSLIRVTDNGIGMDKNDAAICLERHATSKINDIEDIESIHTLGFRGEALSSIASVSRLEIVTKKENENAVVIRAEGGKVLEIKETGAPAGTVVEVRNVFFNTPARRKFLKTNTAELAHIVNIFSNYVFACLKCGFKLISDGETIVEILPGDLLADRIGVLEGKDTASCLVPVAVEKEGIIIKGYIGRPDFTRSNRTGQRIFVNKRPIVSRTISYAVYEAYSALIPKGRFPLVFLFIEVLPDTIDINVHPTKREIRFGNEKLIKDLVARAVSNAFQKDTSRFLGDEKHAETYQGMHAREQSEQGERGGWMVSEKALSGAFVQKLADLGDISEKHYPAVQMNNSYIISETEDGFDIIDQHALHERIIYERIKNDLKNGNSVSQRLLVPVTVEVSREEEILLKNQTDFLIKAGFNIEEFGRRTFAVDMVPAVLDKTDIAVLIKDVINEIKENGGAKAQEDVSEKAIKIMACRAAIKQGDRLSVMEMKNLLSEWRGLSSHYTCPHGRPSVIRMKRDELDKKFHRT